MKKAAAKIYKMIANGLKLYQNGSLFVILMKNKYCINVDTMNFELRADVDNHLMLITKMSINWSILCLQEV